MMNSDRDVTAAVARLAILLGTMLILGWMLIRAFEGLSAEARAFLLGLALGALGAGAPLVAALALLRRTYHAEIDALRERLDAAREETLRVQQAMWHSAVGRQVIERLTAPVPTAPPQSYNPQQHPVIPPPSYPSAARDIAEWPDE